MAAYTEQDLVNIRLALKNGVSEVRIADRWTTFRSLAEMEAIERKIARSLNPRRTKQYVVVPESGL